MSEIVFKKLRGIIDQMELATIQNEINSAKVQRELASRFRLSKSEMGNILAEMFEQDIAKKENKYRIRLR